MPSKKLTPHRKPRKRRKAPEHIQQSAFIAWCRDAASKQTNTAHRSTLEWIHAIPNGYLGSVRSRMKAVQEGVKSGIADVFVPYPQFAKGKSKLGKPKVKYYGLYIEFKVPGNKMSGTQEAFAQHCNIAGYKHVVVYNWQEAVETLLDYLLLSVGTYNSPQLNIA